MKHEYGVYIILFSLIITTVFCGCKDNIYSMLDDYNRHYEPDTNYSYIINPGDSGFSEDSMLDESYSVSSEGSINLAAPYNCKSYEWKFYKTINSKKRIGDFGESFNLTDYVEITDKLYFYGSAGKNKREFRVYIPQSLLAKDEYLGAGTYLLTLTVVGNNNITYTDKCTVIIYEQIYGQTELFKEETNEES